MGLRRFALSFTVVVLALGALQTAVAQESDETPPDRLRLFLDCSGFCNQTFIRQEMNFVDHVLDRQQADVHVLVTDLNTAAGGETFTFDLIGQDYFEGMDFSTTFTASAGATQDQERRGFLRTLQIALVPYLIETSLLPRMSLQVQPASEDEPEQPADDPWNNWVIEFYGDGDADFESRQNAIDTRYGVFVERVTEDWKIQMRPFFNYEREVFEREERTITSTSRRDGVTAYVVRSISPHWSIGAFGDVFTSTFDNVDVRYRLMPAVEYSVFPYREATRRQLTFAYRVGGSDITYNETTIFGEDEQFLPEHTLTAGYEVTQPWGEIDFGMDASQYLSDIDKYSVEFGGGVEVRLTEGLSVEVGGQIELIHNQLNLPQGDADLEEILLRRRQLATNYEAGVRVGFRYRFGSIYNNVVNTRFGGGRNQDQF